MKFGPLNNSSEYRQNYGQELPPIQAKGNLTYLQFIDLIEALWNFGHPEIQFIPYGPINQRFDSDQGYIVYGLEVRKPKANHPRPRLFETRTHPTDPTKLVAIFLENFENMISFTAVHKNPRIAEEMIEAFEDFIIEMTPVLKKKGLEQISYYMRQHDRHEKRFGDDVASRSIVYQVGTQKIIITDVEKLDEVYLQVQLAKPATPDFHATPNLIEMHTFMENGDVFTIMNEAE